MNKVQEQIWIQPEMLAVIKARPDYESGDIYVPSGTLESMQARIELLEKALTEISRIPMNRNAPAALGLCQRAAIAALKEQA